MKNQNKPAGKKLTPTGSNTSRSVKCSNCGHMYPDRGTEDEPGYPGSLTSSTHSDYPRPSVKSNSVRSKSSVCPSCGFENRADESTTINASNEDY